MKSGKLQGVQYEKVTIKLLLRSQIAVVGVLLLSGCSDSESNLTSDVPTELASSDSVAPEHKSAQSIANKLLEKETLLFELPGSGAIQFTPREDAPFDVKKFVGEVSPEINKSAKYYLTGLSLICSDLAFIYPDNDQEVRRVNSEEMETRIKQAKDNLSDGQEFDALSLLADCAVSIEVIDRAQSLSPPKFGVFELDSTTNLPHVRGLYFLSRLQWIELERGQGDLNERIHVIHRMLQASRDFTDGAPMMTRMVTYANDVTAVSSCIRILLNDPYITIRQCDELLSLFDTHANFEKDRLGNVFRMEYIVLANTLHKLESGELSLEEINLARIQKSRLNFENEWSGANQLYRNLLEYRKEPFHTIIKTSSFDVEFEDLTKRGKAAEHDVPFVTLLMFPNYKHFRKADARWVTRMNAIRMLIALKRYQLKNGEFPSKVITALNDVGIENEFIDPYSGKSLNYIIRKGQPIVYSVGIDQLDDLAMQDWEFGRKSGDFIFKLEL